MRLTDLFEDTAVGRLLTALEKITDIPEKAPGCVEALREDDVAIGNIAGDIGLQKLYIYMDTTVAEFNAISKSFSLKKFAAEKAKEIGTSLPEVMEISKGESYDLMCKKERVEIANLLFWLSINERFGLTCMNEDGEFALSVREGWEIVHLSKREIMESRMRRHGLPKIIELVGGSGMPIDILSILSGRGLGRSDHQDRSGDEE